MAHRASQPRRAGGTRGQLDGGAGLRFPRRRRRRARRPAGDPAHHRAGSRVPARQAQDPGRHGGRGPRGAAPLRRRYEQEPGVRRVPDGGGQGGGPPGARAAVQLLRHHLRRRGQLPDGHDERPQHALAAALHRARGQPRAHRRGRVLQARAAGAARGLGHARAVGAQPRELPPGRAGPLRGYLRGLPRREFHRHGRPLRQPQRRGRGARRGAGAAGPGGPAFHRQPHPRA
mmetsp:Transcript_3093/g.9700  ORF Transcript_3093/g.9700 Transcript_3093/m.9700 type:complete len:231 (-) Transcript_3093:1014-1706(-)